MKLSEIDEAVKHRDIKVDRKLVLKNRPVKNVDGNAYAGIEINIGKAAVEPVWYLPGVAVLASSCTSERKAGPSERSQSKSSCNNWVFIPLSFLQVPCLQLMETQWQFCRCSVANVPTVGTSVRPRG